MIEGKRMLGRRTGNLPPSGKEAVLSMTSEMTFKPAGTAGAALLSTAGFCAPPGTAPSEGPTTHLVAITVSVSRPEPSNQAWRSSRSRV